MVCNAPAFQQTIVSKVIEIHGIATETLKKSILGIELSVFCDAGYSSFEKGLRTIKTNITIV